MDNILENLLRQLGLIDGLRQLDIATVLPVMGGLLALVIVMRVLTLAVRSRRRRRIRKLTERRNRLRMELQAAERDQKARKAQRRCDFCSQRMERQALVCPTCHRPNLDRLDAFVAAEYDRRMTA